MGALVDPLNRGAHQVALVVIAQLAGDNVAAAQGCAQTYSRDLDTLHHCTLRDVTKNPLSDPVATVVDRDAWTVSQQPVL